MLNTDLLSTLIFAGSGGGGDLMFADGFEASPDDRFATVANTELLVGAPAPSGPHILVARSVLDNDQPFVGNGTLAVTEFDATSAHGGSVDMDPDGTFSFQPAVGITGTDTFAYVVTNGSTVVDATVSILINARVWFVGWGWGWGCGTGNGTSWQPFNGLSDVAANAAADPDAADDFIYLSASSSAYTGGIELEPG